MGIPKRAPLPPDSRSEPNVPDRILGAMARPTIDHRGPEFRELAHDVLHGVRDVFQTRQPVVMYPASGTGAWEASLVNTLSPGDRVLMFETGHFATLWKQLAEKVGSRGRLPAWRLASWRRRRRRGSPAGGRHQPTASRRCVSSTTRRRPASRVGSHSFDRPSIVRVIPPCFSSDTISVAGLHRLPARRVGEST